MGLYLSATRRLGRRSTGTLVRRRPRRRTHVVSVRPFGRLFGSAHDTILGILEIIHIIEPYAVEISKCRVEFTGFEPISDQFVTG